MLPIEKNARRLIAVAQHFPSGATSDELRGEFEKVTALARPAFYEALRFAKEQRWLVLRFDNDRLVYSVLEELPDEVEPDWSNGGGANGANVAVSSLVRIVGDSAASTRQRIRAAAAVLGYKVQDDAVTEFVKRFLESVCASVDIAADYRIEAGELLRRHEAPRITFACFRSIKNWVILIPSPFQTNPLT
jgi:AraC-like DNA-binding protein